MSQQAALIDEWGGVETDEGDGEIFGSWGGRNGAETQREGKTKARWEQLRYNAELMCPTKHPILQTWQIVLP